MTVRDDRVRRVGHGRTLILGLLVGLAAGLAGAGGALAADAQPTFGTISADASFGTGVTFIEQVDLPAGFVRVELVVDVAGSTRSLVSEVSAVAPGRVNLHDQLDTPLGDQLPNTRITGHYRVTLADRTTVDGPSATVLYSDRRFAWQALEGKIVRVHWTVGSKAFGERALKIGDDAIARIASVLGVTETEPVDFFIYGDRSAFYDVLGPATRENVGGVAFPEIRTLFANIDASTIDDPWVGIVIPHELTHLVLHTATANPYRGLPHWMDEGIAVYLSEGYSASDRADVRSAVADGTLMPLSALTGQFPTTAARFSLGYSEAVSAVDHLVRRFGQEALVKLVRSYATGITDDEAFRNAIGMDVMAFEADWLKDLGASNPVPYGPQAAPAGPVPSGWTGAAPAPGIVPGASGAPVPATPTPSPESKAGAPGPLLLTIGGGIVALVVLVLVLRQAGRNAMRGRAVTWTAPGPWEADEVDVPSATEPEPVVPNESDGSDVSARRSGEP